MDSDAIQGAAAPGFEEVADEFERNFATRGELGAACAAYYRGEKVVDLWGGCRDAPTSAPWERNTLVLVFSTTRGLAAMALAVAHSRGLLDYDEMATIPRHLVFTRASCCVAQIRNTVRWGSSSTTKSLSRSGST